MTDIWRCGRFELQLDRPLVMGILNVTPDSFSDGGAHDDPLEALDWAHRMIEEGADIIDVGGESTRPGSIEVTLAEEMARVRPIVSRLNANESVPISIDTRHAKIASACVIAGADIVNDVSGFREEGMIEVAVGSNAGLVVMHMLGEPGTMQDEPRYDDVVSEVCDYLERQVGKLVSAGVSEDRIAVDPGIGFGKTVEHNLDLVRGIPKIKGLGFPVVLGASRKRFIGELTGERVACFRVGGSVAAAIASVARGADVVRVHDVPETVQALRVAKSIGDL